MKSWCVCIIAYCAFASTGCGSSASSKSLIGSYQVMISSMGKSDPDVMTVTPGMNDKMLLTFSAGILTDTTGPNPDGLISSLHDSSMLTLDMQPVHIDHSTGYQDGNVTGMGVLMPDGSCDVTLHFSSASGATQDYEITGMKL